MMVPIGARLRGCGRVGLLVAVPPALLAASLPFPTGLEQLPALQGPMVDSAFGLLAAGALYLVAHMVRALRLALLAGPSLHVHLRTVALLHFYTAPVSFAVPFKLGELFRWQQLARLSGDRLGALVVLLLERMLDASVLLAVLAVGLTAGQAPPSHTVPLVLVLAGLTLLGLFVVLLAPGCLQATQAYILRNHSARLAIRLLRVTDATRLMTASANGMMRRTGVLLLALSLVIWSMESGMLMLLSAQLAPGLRPALAALPTLMLSPDLASPAHGLVGLYTLLGLSSLMLAWPVATLLYLRRIFLPRRSSSAQAAPLSHQVPRRIQLYAGAKLP